MVGYEAVTEAHITESVRLAITESVGLALEELGQAGSYDIVRVSITNDGQWCARLRLELKGKSIEGISVCIDGDPSSVRNVDRFKDKISMFLGLSKG